MSSDRRFGLHTRVVHAKSFVVGNNNTGPVGRLLLFDNNQWGKNGKLYTCDMVLLNVHRPTHHLPAVLSEAFALPG